MTTRDPKAPYSVRLSVADVEKLIEAGIQLAPLIQNTVKRAINANECPVCKKPLHEKKKRSV